jgi:hypothetical protein
MAKKRPFRKKLLAGLAVLAGTVLLAFETAGGGSTPAGERWFWIAVGVGLVGLGIAELVSAPSSTPPPRKLGD